MASCRWEVNVTERLYTTDELLRIIKVPPRTHNRWLQHKFIEPVVRGVGRGKSHMWDRTTGIWEMALDELFSVYPNTSTSVELRGIGPDDPQGPLELTQSALIVDYLKKHRDILRHKNGRICPFIVSILGGYKNGPDGKPTNKRFVEVYVEPIGTTQNNIDFFLGARGEPLTCRQWTVRTVSLIGLEQLNAYFGSEEQRMGI